MKKYLIELIGAFFLAFTFVMAANNSGSAMAPLAVGGILIALHLVGSPISGGHYNPLVTLAMLMRGKTDRTDAIYYILFQMVGALFAAFAAAFLLQCKGAIEIRPIQHDVTCSILSEFLGAFVFVYVVLNVTDHREHSNASLAIGFAAMAMMYVLGPISGGAFNPAIAVSISASGMASWGEWWIYLVGGLLGSAAATTVFGAIVSPPASGQTHEN